MVVFTCLAVSNDGKDDIRMHIKERDMKLKMMITSVGSLVGQNLLDALDYEVFPRRDKVEVVGVNTLADSTNVFRCDAFYKVPMTASEEYLPKMTEILLKEQPDIIFPGRDVDAYRLHDLIYSNDAIKAVLPYGAKDAIGIGLNKLETWRFCEKYALPFANTFVLGISGDEAALDTFIEANGYPLIGKPIEGFASKGVFYLRTREEVHKVAAFPGYMLQEYLGDAESLRAYFEMMDGPTPLFAHAPNVYHITCQTVIHKDGTLSPFFISKNQHDSGRTVNFRKIHHPEAEGLATQMAKAIYKEGGAGPFGVQFRPSKDGRLKAQEMNLRTNGNTFPRLVLGQDDIGLLTREFLPEKALEILPEALVGDERDIILKSVSAHRLYRAQSEAANEEGYWKAEG